MRTPSGGSRVSNRVKTAVWVLLAGCVYSGGARGRTTALCLTQRDSVLAAAGTSRHVGGRPPSAGGGRRDGRARRLDQRSPAVDRRHVGAERHVPRPAHGRRRRAHASSLLPRPPPPPPSAAAAAGVVMETASSHLGRRRLRVVSSVVAAVSSSAARRHGPVWRRRDAVPGLLRCVRRLGVATTPAVVSTWRWVQ